MDAHPESPNQSVVTPHARRKPRRRFLFWMVVLLAAAWLLPAVVRLNSLHDAIAAALAANLGRAVRIGDVHPHLVSGWDSGMGVGLGVEVDNVEIADDARFGIEPLARIETLEARLALRSIWHRRLEFSHIVLRNPSINLTRDRSGQLNVVAILTDRLRREEADIEASGASQPARYPDVRVVGGRLNFKLENRKKSFYIAALRTDLRAPRRSDEPWQFEYSGTPTRSSFEQVPAFTVRGAGQIGPFPAGLAADAGVAMKLTWQIRDALLGEVSSVLLGSDQGTHGLVNLTGEAIGTTALLRISGKSMINDLHRWDVIPETVAAEIPAEFSGVLDWQEDAFQLTRFTLPLHVNKQKSGVIELTGRIENLSTAATPKLEAEAREISIAALAVLAEPFAIRMNPLIGVSGKLSAQLVLHGLPREWHGELRFEDLEFTRRQLNASGNPDARNVSRIEVRPATVNLAQGTFELHPTAARLGAEGSAQLSMKGDLTSGAVRVSLRGGKAQLSELLAWMPEPEAQAIDAGRGTASFNVDAAIAPGRAAEYSGSATIADAQIRVNKSGEPLDVSSARVQMRGRDLVARSFAGKLSGSEVRGSATIRLASDIASSEAPSGQAMNVDFNMEAEALDLDRLPATPSSEKPSWLSGLLPGNRAVPQLEGVRMAASGKLKAERVTFRGVEFRGAAAKVEWSDGQLQLTDISAGLASGKITGSLLLAPAGNSATAPASLELSAAFLRLDAMQLSEILPEFTGQFAGDLSGRLSLKGSGQNWEQVWNNLSGGGEISAVNLSLSRWEIPASLAGQSEPPERRVAQFSQARAKFEISDQAISLVQFEAAPAPYAAGETRTLQATGAIGFDRSVQILGVERAAGRTAPVEYRWSGTLAAPQLQESSSLASNVSGRPR